MNPVAVLLAPTDGGLAMARALGRRGVETIMLGEGGWVMRSRLSEAIRAPQLPAGRGAWLRELEMVAEKKEGVLVPCTDRLCEFVREERANIPVRLRSFESEGSPHHSLIDKGSLHAVAADAGVRVPWTLRMSSRDDWDSVLERARFPCLLKPAVSYHWRRLIGERRAIVVRSPEELLRAAAPGFDAGIEMLVMEHVPGPDRNLEGSVTIRLADGSYPLAYGIRKLRAYPPGYGSGSLHESAEVPETMAQARLLLDACGFEGIANVEFKRDEDTGELVLIDVNPRLPQCWGVADAAGTDGSWRLYASLAGLPLGAAPTPSPGVRSIAPSIEAKALVSNLASGHQRIGEVVASYRGVRDASGVGITDPLPVLSLIVRQLKALLRTVLRRVAGRRRRVLS